MTFSIVIPVYNGAQFLESAIQSALNQTRKADEILIFDDNSRDSSKDIVSKFGSKVKYFFNPKGPSGFVNGWNEAISLTNSDFITILHQDDLLYSSFLLVAEKNLKLHPEVRHLFAVCDYINESNDFLNEVNNQKKEITGIKYTGSEYFKAYQKNEGKFPHIHRCPGVITHKSIFLEGCNYNAKAGHIADDDFFYRVGQFTPVIGIHKPMAAYRIHQKSETSSIGDLILVSRLAHDYLYQVRQWSTSNFIGKSEKEYFAKNALFFSKRLFAYGIKKNDRTAIDDAIKLSRELKKEGISHKSFFINTYMWVLSFKFFNSIIRTTYSRLKT